MRRSPSTIRWPALRSRRGRAGLAGVALAGAIGVLPPAALAQNSTCSEIRGQLDQRRSIIERIKNLGKKAEAKDACAAFGKLVANGTEMLKWTEVNKDWCQVPDSFVAGFKTDHERAVKLRRQACGAAAKQAEMAKKAQQQGSGLLGGGGLEGTYRIPSGAL